MWNLTKLSATNICAFEQLSYAPIQNQATLIFGNNLDNDSQNSNGSGKSALIEVLAIGITGEPLRKVNIDEIINDRFEEATVSLTFTNHEEVKTMTINRRLSRKSPQEIQIIVQHGPYDTDTEEIKQATVADYNKYVLDQIGLSKDDILRNFILTARKYQSFLSSSDKEKKEIINRFSNGVMVDESIEALRKDMEPVQAELSEAEKEVAECIGRVSALENEIQVAITESADRKANRATRIASIKDLIVEKRAQIRSYNQSINEANDKLDALDALDVAMQELEKSDADTTKAYSTISEQFKKLGVQAISDYNERIEANRQSLQGTKSNIVSLNTQHQAAVKSVAELEASVKKLTTSNEQAFAKFDAERESLEAEITKLQDKVRTLKQYSNELSQKRTQANTTIANLEKQLAGVIECPKCHHEFTLANNVDVVKTRKELSISKLNLEAIEKDITINDKDYTQCVEEGKEKRSQQSQIDSKRQPLINALNDAQSDLGVVKNKCKRLADSIETAQAREQELQEAIANTRKRMFDEVFDNIDLCTKNLEQAIANLENDIKVAEASIATYEDQIKTLESASDDDMLARLKESKEKYDKAWAEAVKRKEAIEFQLNKLKAQEATFIEFKTYLANTKIKAISQITNDFLDAIGSDIRVNLSGYTVLKSGKVRDKISVSLIRDGIDCGSFDKFSAGEKCRVELASVLALHKLSNVNCEDGKGLNLLVIDEILDCTDEAGLANVFKALNDTQVTALVVSHGNIAENYPNRLVVTKQNGVSSINETTE